MHTLYKHRTHVLIFSCMEFQLYNIQLAIQIKTSCSSINSRAKIKKTTKNCKHFHVRLFHHRMQMICSRTNGFITRKLNIRHTNTLLHTCLDYAVLLSQSVGRSVWWKRATASNIHHSTEQALWSPTRQWSCYLVLNSRLNNSWNNFPF